MSAIDTIEADDQLPALFCRALYDYEAQDASALSFRRDDIIEVLMQEPSGWWDGLLGKERGWFPSNYVTIISEEEAEAAFAESEMLEPQADEVEPTVDMSHAMGEMVPDTEDWDENAAYQVQNGVNNAQTVSGPSNDFWEPQVTASGQVFFVNTRTGEKSRDLPQEDDHEAPVDDLATLMSQQPSSSRAGASSNLGFLNGLTPEDNEPGSAGFGLPRRSGTPEPWHRKLADDGMSYFYVNKVTGMTQWTRPDASVSNAPTRSNSPPLDTDALARQLRSNTSAPHFQQNGMERASVYSDDSDVQPADMFYRAEVDSTTDTLVAQSQSSHSEQPASSGDALQDLTSAETAASTLQASLDPPPPTGIEELSEHTFVAVQAVLDKLSSITYGEFSMEQLVNQVAYRVRELLYVCAPPSTQMPSNVRASNSFDTPAHAAHAALRSSQRRVTATLSKLVLSARALEYEADITPSDTPARLKGDAEELIAVLRRFITEVQRTSNEAAAPLKRVQAVLLPDGVGSGMFGGGSGGDWLGFGWAGMRRDPDTRILGPEVLTEVSVLLSNIDVQLSALSSTPKDDYGMVQTSGEVSVGHLASFLGFVSKLDVARHVDLDGVGLRASQNPYWSFVMKARTLLRMLEAAIQAVFDDNSALLLAVQHYQNPDPTVGDSDVAQKSSELERIVAALRANIFVAAQTLEALVTTGHDQISISPIDFSHSMDWRARHLASIHVRHRSMATIHAPHSDEEGYVGMEDAFHRPSGKSRSTAASRRQSGELTDIPSTDDDYDDMDSHDDIDDGTLMEDDEGLSPTAPQKPKRPKKKSKIVQMLGEGLPSHILNDVESKPWYLRSNNDPAEILIEGDGSVRGGTAKALVEHLTAHDATNPTYARAFMMSFKSFMTMDELFDSLVNRFYLPPPPKLTENEYEDWAKNKQHLIQMRVLNTFKTMVTDDDVLEKEDQYIFDRIKEFITAEEVASLPAAKQLTLLLERGRARKVTALNGPPPPIMPKSSRKLKLLDIDPLELARQLTILESELFMKIRTMECFLRSREQKAAHGDNIATVIQTSNKIADWVADQILSRDDSRKRAAVLKQFISTADRCRILHNFSTMVAITSGLNTPPIRRLKRTWDHIPPKLMAHFNSCEQVMESTKNYNAYRQAMSAVNPPCVPFIGVYLTTLQFIHDGSKDTLPGDLINFRKRQKASEVIQDIKRWQAAPFHFTPIPLVLGYLQDSLDVFNAGEDVRERFWNLSLEREPREREDERMARLLQESGFL